jgi:hypothetical protein
MLIFFVVMVVLTGLRPGKCRIRQKELGIERNRVRQRKIDNDADFCSSVTLFLCTPQVLFFRIPYCTWKSPAHNEAPRRQSAGGAVLHPSRDRISP